jgi:hypothetical protein
VLTVQTVSSGGTSALLPSSPILTSLPLLLAIYLARCPALHNISIKYSQWQELNKPQESLPVAKPQESSWQPRVSRNIDDKQERATAVCIIMRNIIQSGLDIHKAIAAWFFVSAHTVYAFLVVVLLLFETSD